jgi:hypothetical protein
MRAKVREIKKPTAPEIKVEEDFPEPSINADPSVIYNISPDGLTILLCFSDAGLIKQIEPNLMKVLEEANIRVLK